jgi:hypothetical protein
MHSMQRVPQSHGKGDAHAGEQIGVSGIAGVFVLEHGLSLVST